MEYVIYTFKSSNLAYLALSKVESENIRARLVPLLPEIDAGCGLCLRYEKKFDEKAKEIFPKIWRIARKYYHNNCLFNE